MPTSSPWAMERAREMAARLRTATTPGDLGNVVRLDLDIITAALDAARAEGRREFHELLVRWSRAGKLTLGIDDPLWTDTCRALAGDPPKEP